MAEPEIIAEQTGLKIWRNARNAFVVCRLLYTADPNKRDPKWRVEAAHGMTPEQAARELDIDFTALLGAKVFPEITARRPEIVIEPIDFGPDRKYWGGLDHGSRNPASFQVYTIDDGTLYCVWELYKPAPDVSAFAREMQEFPYWSSIRYIAADPDFFKPKHSTGHGMVALELQFREAGVRNLVKGDNQREREWITMMREHWAQDDPTYKIFNTCQNHISELETAIYINQSQHQLDTQNYREEISDWHNHSLDACKYLMLTKPQEQGAVQYQDPRLVERWAQSSKSRANRPHGPQSAPLGMNRRGYR